MSIKAKIEGASAATQLLWEELQQEQPPPCFPSLVAWRQYQEAARLAPPLEGGYCTDCTIGYQLRMRVAGRCLHPETRFDRRGLGYR